MMLTLPAVLVASALVGAVMGGKNKSVCKPTPCFKGNCDGNAKAVAFQNFKLDVRAWGASGYTSAGQVLGHHLVEDEFGIFLHGPLFRPAQQKQNDYAPPLYIVGSLTNKIWRLDDIYKTPSGLVSANMKFVAWSPAPSTIYPVPPTEKDGPERLMVAEGNPFLWNGNNGTHSLWEGGVDVIDEEKCTTIFPKTRMAQAIGRVVNTVECHASGFCFFSVWKFFDDTLPLGMDNDCLWWCRVQDVSDPMACLDAEVLKDTLGNPICHVDGKGAVHGFRIGKTDPTNANAFDLFLLYTGKATFDDGDSEIYKLRVEVSENKDGVKAASVMTMAPWGTELTQKTMSKGHDTGVDHAWVDDDGKYVWVGTFRKTSDGIHMLEYDTGKLVHSIFGISNIVPKKYMYTSGVTGKGAWGKPGSVIGIATCMEYGQQFMGGKSAVVLVDISGKVNGTEASTIMV